MKKHVSFMAAVLAIILTLCIAGESRDWTNRDGRTIKGGLVQVDGDGMKLKLSSGKMTDMPFKLLSDLTPAEAPFPEKTEEDSRLGDMETIYAGKSPAEFAAEIAGGKIACAENLHSTTAHAGCLWHFKIPGKIT